MFAGFLSQLLSQCYRKLIAVFLLPGFLSQIISNTIREASFHKAIEELLTTCVLHLIPKLPQPLRLRLIGPASWCVCTLSGYQSVVFLFVCSGQAPCLNIILHRSYFILYLIVMDELLALANAADAGQASTPCKVV